jgi:hypothetical protein
MTQKMILSITRGVVFFKALLESNPGGIPSEVFEALSKPCKFEP